MKNLRTLGAAIVLTGVLSLSAFAGETDTPPCAPPDPGETHSPPCSGGTIAPDPTTPAIVSTSPASDQEYLVAEAAISLFESLLPIF